MRNRKGDQRRVNGSRLKFLQFEMIGLIPKFTPNPRDPGDVWSSYEGATPTQESPRNKLQRTWMQTQTTAQKQARYTHRLNRRTKRHVVGSTDAQGRQRKRSRHRLNWCGQRRDRRCNDPRQQRTSKHRLIRCYLHGCIRETPVQFTRDITRKEKQAPV